MRTRVAQSSSLVLLKRLAGATDSRKEMPVASRWENVPSPRS